MIAVDEREIDAAAGPGEMVEELGQHDVAVTGVKGHVREVPDGCLGLDEVERVHLDAVSGDSPQGATLGGTDLHRQLRLELAEHALQRRPLAERHLPCLGPQELDHRRIPSGAF